MKQLPCKSNEGDADSGYILTMDDGAEESRSGVDSHLHSGNQTTRATGVEFAARGAW